MVESERRWLLLTEAWKHKNGSKYVGHETMFASHCTPLMMQLFKAMEDPGFVRASIRRFDDDYDSGSSDPSSVAVEGLDGGRQAGV